MLRVFTAFSGYDSQCMALDRAGIDYELVGWSEIDKYAIAAHNAVYPQYADRNFGDISKIDWAQVPDFDLFTYSSPCQDFSTAGLQKGGAKGSGTRSSLLWECELAIAAKRPKYLLFENVAALVSSKFIRLFNEWQLLLERIGYTNFTQVLNAKDYGVPQNRERVFMVSVRDCEQVYYFPKPVPPTKNINDILEDNVQEEYYMSERMIDYVYSEGGKNGGYKPARGVQDGNRPALALTANYAKSPRQGNYIRVAGTLVGGKWDRINESTKRVYSPKGIAPTQTAGGGGNLETKIMIQRGHGYNQGGGKDIAPSVTTSSYECNNVVLERDYRVRKLTPKECFRLMGVADTDSDKITSVLSKSRCYQVAGNSIVVDVLAAIFDQLFNGNKNINQQIELF